MLRSTAIPPAPLAAPARSAAGALLAALTLLWGQPASAGAGGRTPGRGPHRASETDMVLLQYPALHRLECTLLFRCAEPETVVAALVAEVGAGAQASGAALAVRPGGLGLDLSLALLEVDDTIAARVAAWAEPEVDALQFESARARLARRWAALRLLPGTLAADELALRTHGPDAVAGPSAWLAELDALDLEEFAAGRVAILSRARLALGAAGPDPVGAVAQRFAELLAPLPEGSPAPAAEAPPFLEPPRTRVHLVDLPHADATLVRISAPGTRRLAPDEAALAVFTRHLAQGAPGATLWALVEEFGLELTRPPAFRPEWGRSGSFELELRAPHEVTADALAAVVRWLREARAPLDAEALVELREGILTGPEHRPLDVHASLARALELRAHGYPDDYWEQRARHLRALDPGAVAASVARHLDPDRLVVVAVGPADALAESLERVGPVTRDASTPESLVDRMFGALGGRDLWRTTRFVETELELRPGSGDLVVPLRNWRDLDRPRLRVEQGGAPPVVLVLDGDEAWRRSGTRAETLPDPVRDALARAAWYDPHALLRQLAVGGPALARETGWRRFELVEGPAAGVWIELDDEGRPARLGAREPGGEALHELAGWRTLDGLPAPERIVRHGTRGWTRTYVRLAVLPELDESLFAR